MITRGIYVTSFGFVLRINTFSTLDIFNGIAAAGSTSLSVIASNTAWITNYNYSKSDLKLDLKKGSIKKL